MGWTGITADVRRLLRALSWSLLVAAAGCDLRTLQQAQLVGGPDATPPDGATDTTGADADSAGSDADAPEAIPGCPSIPCEAFETCEPSTMRCTLRTGPGMLSGGVLDACTGHAVTARIGIAGRRLCSVVGKGSYFFNNLPEGTLALIAFKEGYKPFEAPVVITAAGTIKDILLQPDTPLGCAEPPPPEVACVCNLPGCP